MGLMDRLLGVKCRDCGKRQSLDQFVGCSKCGDAVCTVCTAGGPDSRICTPCEEGLSNG